MEKDIQDFTGAELTNSGFIKSIFDGYKDPDERDKILCEIVEVAKREKVLGKVKKEIDRCKKDTRVVNNIENNFIKALLIFGENGEPEPTVENYLSVMRNDEYIKNLFKYDVFARRIVCYDNNITRSWTDQDDSVLRAYIEKNYGIYNQLKYYDAFNTVLKERTFHPIKNIIEASDWDGKPRIDRFLTDILKCEDSDYMREVSRMIFYGGISRLYNPGCKFDYMPILIGKQGSYKSSIVKWLALNDSYYTDVSTIEGKEALDNIQGCWICEFAELLAMVRTKDVEAMKSFITRTIDRYRQSYDRRTGEYPRQCIFIGTTNDYQFLADKTGNRRYLPIEIGLKMGALNGKEHYVKDYILECWREALSLFKEGKTYLSIPSKYYKSIVIKQENVLEDDPKTGLILQYLNDKKVGEKVCGLEIFTSCFNGIKKNYSRGEAKEISRVMSYLNDWERGEKAFRFKEYGVQKYWEKIEYHEDDWGDLD